MNKIGAFFQTSWSYAESIGKRIRPSPTTAKYITHFCIGVLSQTVVQLGNRIVIPVANAYATPSQLQAMETGNLCSKEMLDEIQTFSDTRRTVAPYIVTSMAMVAPVAEELFVRGLFQTVLLKEEGAKWIQNRWPSRVKMWQGLPGKCIRVTVATSLFSIGHMPTGGIRHGIATIPASFVASVLAEELSVAASIGMHACNNALHFFVSGLATKIFECYRFPSSLG